MCNGEKKFTQIQYHDLSWWPAVNWGRASMRLRWRSTSHHYFFNASTFMATRKKNKPSGVSLKNGIPRPPSNRHFDSKNEKWISIFWAFFAGLPVADGNFVDVDRIMVIKRPKIYINKLVKKKKKKVPNIKYYTDLVAANANLDHVQNPWNSGWLINLP